MKKRGLQAHSTPPRKPCASSSQKRSGSTPATPRYTLSTFVSLLALTITLLMTWVVVTYRLPLQPARAAPKPRRLTLYLKYLIRAAPSPQRAKAAEGSRQRGCEAGGW